MNDTVRVFGRIGLLSFGGPAAQIALMHKELVTSRAWLTEAEFLRALSFCMLLPGPEAMQLATYAGWKRHGIAGGLIGGGLFVLPGALVIALLALIYGYFGNLPIMQALFVGVKAAVVVVVIDALLKIARRALTGPSSQLIALAAFVALFFFALPFPIVIGLSALIGAIMASEPQVSALNGAPDWRGSLRIFSAGLSIWVAPLVLVWAWNDEFLLDVGLFFSRLAIVSFGGAYAGLAYMTQDIVVGYGWIGTAQMLDALGLAETTPGPLILVTQFVAMIAGLAQSGPGLAIAAGLLTLWVTFVPCFTLIFAGAPLIAWLEGRPRLTGALAAITAAVVGVIANLSLWFALHVFFGSVTPFVAGPVSTILPDLESVQPLSLIIALAAAGMLIWRGWPLWVVLALCAAVSAAGSILLGML